MKKSPAKILALAPRLLVVIIMGLYLATSTPTYSQTKAKVDDVKVVVPALPPSPTIEVKIETQEEPVAFTTKTVLSKTRAEGVKVVTKQGRMGKRVITYEVTFTDGIETSRNQIKTEVVIQPVDKIITKGTVLALDPNASKPAPPPIVLTGRRQKYLDWLKAQNTTPVINVVTPQPKPQPEQRIIDVSDQNRQRSALIIPPPITIPLEQ